MNLTLHNSNPVDLVQRLYRLFGEGRLDETFELMAPDIVLQEPGDPNLLPWAGEFHGHDGLRRFYDGLAAGLSQIDIDGNALRFLPAGKCAVLVLGTERGTAATTGRTYVTRSAWVWEVRDGFITQLTAYHDTAAMADAMRS